MVRYDEHAEFQLARRAIQKAWVEDVLKAPDFVEEVGRRTSHWKRIAGRRIMLRVVTPTSDLDYVVTAYFDRKRPCA